MKVTRSKLRKIIKEEIELESLKNVIRKTVREMDFKDKESFEKYKSQHKMRPTTKVNIAGKETTVGAASGDKDTDTQNGSNKDPEETRDALKSMFAKDAEEYKDDDHWGPIYDKISKTEDWEEMLDLMSWEGWTQYDIMTLSQEMGADKEALDYIEDIPEFNRMERG